MTSLAIEHQQQQRRRRRRRRLAGCNHHSHNAAHHICNKTCCTLIVLPPLIWRHSHLPATDIISTVWHTYSTTVYSVYLSLQRIPLIVIDLYEVWKQGRIVNDRFVANFLLSTTLKKKTWKDEHFLYVAKYARSRRRVLTFSYPSMLWVDAISWAIQPVNNLLQQSQRFFIGDLA